MGQKHLLCMETVLCAAVGTASHQHGSEACTVYADRTVCSCRHSKSSACTAFERFGILLEKVKDLPNESALNLIAIRMLKFSFDSPSNV